jgi:hypothetical protein
VVQLLGDCECFRSQERGHLLTRNRLGGVYQAGYFEMSTWIPFIWAVINTLVLILSSFAIYGGL